MAITVEGKRYDVASNLGFNHSAGVYAKVVKTEDGERIAVRGAGERAWRFWSAWDRVRPLRDGLQHGRHKRP